jgi:DNA end-binding protein Ku
MRAIWKGSISFGLVNVPISLYPATAQKELSFRMLRRSDLSPINYKRVAENDGKEVPWDQIVKGYEYEKGKFVVITSEDFERADIKATQTIDVVEFVHLHEIDPVFFDKPYYLEPQKQGAKAYVLLRDALKKMEMVGIAKVVIKTRARSDAFRRRTGEPKWAANSGRYFRWQPRNANGLGTDRASQRSLAAGQVYRRLSPGLA